MKIFKNCVDCETRLNSLSQMLRNHFIDLKDRTKKLDFAYFCLLYQLTEYRINILMRILEAISKHHKVIVKFELSKGEESHRIGVDILIADNLSWGDLFNGLDSKDNGLCLSFCFDGDMDTSPWYFASEDMLRGSVLAKVLDDK